MQTTQNNSRESLDKMFFNMKKYFIQILTVWAIVLSLMPKTKALQINSLLSQASGVKTWVWVVYAIIICSFIFLLIRKIKK